MHLRNFRVPTAVAGLALVAGTVIAPASAVPIGPNGERAYRTPQGKPIITPGRNDGGGVQPKPTLTPEFSPKEPNRQPKPSFSRGGAGDSYFVDPPKLSQDYTGNYTVSFVPTRNDYSYQIQVAGMGVMNEFQLMQQPACVRFAAISLSGNSLGRYYNRFSLLSPVVETQEHFRVAVFSRLGRQLYETGWYGGDDILNWEWPSACRWVTSGTTFARPTKARVEQRTLAQTPSKQDCNKAIKILTQYQRLAKDRNVKLSPQRIAELNRKRDAGTITSNDLPGTLQREFPGQFNGMTLNEICRLCR